MLKFKVKVELANETINEELSAKSTALCIMAVNRKYWGKGVRSIDAKCIKDK